MSFTARPMVIIEILKFEQARDRPSRLCNIHQRDGMMALRLNDVKALNKCPSFKGNQMALRSLKKFTGNYNIINMLQIHALIFLNFFVFYRHDLQSGWNIVTWKQSYPTAINTDASKCLLQAHVIFDMLRWKQQFACKVLGRSSCQWTWVKPREGNAWKFFQDPRSYSSVLADYWS